MTIPISTFEGTLRQITPECLTAQGEMILRASAPKFLPLTETERHKVFEAQRDNLDPNITNFYVSARPLRRFSGDYFSDFLDEHRLDVGCYYSVCTDESGSDYGTLVNELNAYRSTDADYYTIFVDCLSPEIANHFNIPRSAHILALVSQPGKLLNALSTEAPEDLKQRLQGAAKANTQFGITLGCVVSKARIEGVIDLRQIDAQYWFFDRYVPKGPIPTPAKEFTDILPELLQPTLGGSMGSNMRLQAIGADLRTLGLNALIYPSARTDVAVSYRNGVLQRWRGWNMVIYRGGFPRKVVHQDLGGWETQFWNGITCLKRNPDTETEEWWVGGLEELNLMRYHIVMKKKNILP